MYPLFELACLFSLQPKEGSHRPHSANKIPRITAAAWTEDGERSLLALAINNGNVLLRYANSGRTKPVMHQLPWLQSSTQRIVSMCFDPSGTWLLCAVADSTLYIVPLLAIMDATAKVDYAWSLDDATKIEMNGKRAHPTCVTWWKTFDQQHIAIVGSELGEICFINLVTKKEVGGTYITVAIKSLELVQDDLQDIVYLLITGSNGFQWQLLLEHLSIGYQWPLEHEAEALDRHNRDISSDSLRSTNLLTTSSSSESTFSISQSSDIRSDHQPQRLTKFAGHTHLFPQYVKGRHFIAGYYSPTNILSIHSTDLNIVPLFVYKIPNGCDQVVITDRINFALSTSRRRLYCISSQLSESSIDGKKDFSPEAELQNFSLPLEEKIIFMTKRSGSQFNCRRNSESRLLPRSAPSSPRYNARVRRPSGSLGLALVSGTGPRRIQMPKDESSIDDIKISSPTILDGCLIVMETSVFECRPRVSPEHMFLELVLIHQDLRASEKLSISLGLDLNRLYEAAADNKLSQGQFASAVRLYQLSKCPHVRSVANFAAHGCIAELLSYVRVLLFNHGQVEFSLTDRRHFANMELLCYVHQSLELKSGPVVLFQAFRQFLKDNSHYSELLAIQLLSEHGLLDLLHWLAMHRGLLFAMAEELLKPQSPSWLDASTATSFRDRGFGALLHGKDNESFLKCLTEPRLSVYLLIHPLLLQKHSHFQMQIISAVSSEFLHRAALLYDPCCYAVQSFVLKHISKIHSSTNSSNEDATYSEFSENPLQILIETFAAILLILNASRKISPFSLSFLNSEMDRHTEMKNLNIVKDSESVSRRARLPRRSSPISCGLAHAALIRNGDVYTWGKSEKCCLGHGHLQQECLPPFQLQVFAQLSIKVVAVACGAYHCVALTNHGVYAWGASNFGQVGTGKIDKEPHPVPLETLINEQIVSIACGQYHSMALTDDGRVFTWGWGVHGQLGHGNPNDYFQPHQIEALLGEVVVRVSAGYGHSAVLTAKGDVYTFGCGLFGQLGLGSLNKYSTPQHVEIPEKINLLSCGYFHNVVVSASNKIYTWGSNPQLLRLQAQASRKARIQAHMKHKSNIDSSGIDEETAETETATQSSVSNKTSEPSEHMKGLQSHLIPSVLENNITAPITQVACGSHHSAVITVDGEAFTWGRNLDGQLGNGTRKEQKTPGPVIGLSKQKLTHIACGHDFTIAIDSDGRVWGWGHNDSGQIGFESESVPACTKTIMIKTNKRMVQLRNTAQWGIVQPQEMTGLAPPLSTYEYQPTLSFETDNMDSDNSFVKERLLLLKSLSSLENLEDPSYGCKTLHLVIELFSGFYNPQHIISWALKCKNFQLAAKVCLLQKDINQSFAYQLQALHQLSVGASNTSVVIATMEFYLKLIPDDDVENIKMFLHHVLNFWVTERLPVNPLEEFLLCRLKHLIRPLSALLICFDDLSSNGDLDLAHYILSHMSTKFSLALASAVITQINAGAVFNEFFDLFSSEGQLEKISSSGLNDFLLNDVNSLQSITISSCGLESLLCSLDQEISSPITNEAMINGSSEIVAFSCGHHFTSRMFYSTILPKFEEAMRANFSFSLARTSQAILASYKTDGLLPMSCPDCVINGIKEHS